MKVVNTVDLYSGYGVAKLKLLIKFNILADELSSFNADIMPHAIMMVADVVGKVDTPLDPWKRNSL